MLTVVLLVFAVSITGRLLFRKFLDLPGYRGKLLADNSGYENLMPEDRFWQLIQTSRTLSKRNYLLQCDVLTEQLYQLPVEEIVQFERTFTVLMAKTYTAYLWEAACALNGGCSDDCFEYFRSWLIAQGKENFYWTIRTQGFYS